MNVIIPPKVKAVVDGCIEVTILTLVHTAQLVNTEIGGSFNGE